MRADLGLTTLLLALTACGGPDAVPDAASPKGSWRVTSRTAGTTTTDDAALDGAVVLGDAEIALGLASPSSGFITTYALAQSGNALRLADGTMVPFLLSSGATQLTLQLTDSTLVLAPASSAVQMDAYPVKGTVTLAQGATPMVNPRAALVFLVRSQDGTTDFVDDPRDDVALVFTGPTASFDLSRTRGALGTDRVTFGPVTAGISIAYVVVYDGDKAGSLTDPFSPCAANATHCVRGVATLVLGYRDGSSAELAASPYAYLGLGWTTALPGTDQRGGHARPALISGDGTKMPPFDVTVPAGSAQVAVPKLDLTASAK
jgi:hypothetical protein